MNRAQTAKSIFALAFVCLCIGLLWSRFAISLGMILFLIAGLISLMNGSALKQFSSNWAYIATTAIFFIFLISGIWSEDTDYFLNRMRIKLPFLFLPFAFSLTPKLSPKDIQKMMLFFIALVFTSILWSLFQFSLNAETYIDNYGKGQILPTPIHHIRYSILISAAVLFGIYLLSAKFERLIRHQDKIIVLILCAFITYQHFLAVRSGLMTLYVVLLCTLFYIGRKKKYRQKALIASAVGLVLIFLAAMFVPTIKNKVNYMRYSLEQFRKKDNIRDLSDSRRLASIYAGVELTQNNPLLGVGIGDIMNETDKYLEQHYPDLTKLELLPHNQYILTSASTGLPGLLIFLVCCLVPLIFKNAFEDILVLGTHGILLSSYLVEHTIESQIGVAAYIFLLLFSIKVFYSVKQAHA